MRVRKDEERSTSNLTIRMKPSMKAKLKILAEHNDIGMAEQVELLVEENFEKLDDWTKTKINFSQYF